MKKKKDRPLFFTLIRIAASMAQLLSLLNHLKSLIKHEAVVAKKNLLYLILIFFMIFTITLTIWISATCLFTLGLMSLQISLASALGIVLIINLFLLFTFILLMIRIKKRIFFPETNRFFCDLLDI